MLKNSATHFQFLNIDANRYRRMQLQQLQKVRRAPLTSATRELGVDGILEQLAHFRLLDFGRHDGDILSFLYGVWTHTGLLQTNFSSSIVIIIIIIVVVVDVNIIVIYLSSLLLLLLILLLSLSNILIIKYCQNWKLFSAI